MPVAGAALAVIAAVARREVRIVSCILAFGYWNKIVCLIEWMFDCNVVIFLDSSRVLLYSIGAMHPHILIASAHCLELASRYV